MFEDVGLQPPEHVRTQHVVQLLDLVLLCNVGKLLQEDLQFTANRQVYSHTADNNYRRQLLPAADFLKRLTLNIKPLVLQHQICFLTF